MILVRLASLDKKESPYASFYLFLEVVSKVKNNSPLLSPVALTMHYTMLFRAREGGSLSIK
jgi:hypothetical protein